MGRIAQYWGYCVMRCRLCNISVTFHVTGILRNEAVSICFWSDLRQKRARFHQNSQWVKAWIILVLNQLVVGRRLWFPNTAVLSTKLRLCVAHISFHPNNIRKLIVHGRVFNWRALCDYNEALKLEKLLHLWIVQILLTLRGPSMKNQQQQNHRVCLPVSNL